MLVDQAVDELKSKGKWQKNYDHEYVPEYGWSEAGTENYGSTTDINAPVFSKPGIDRIVGLTDSNLGRSFFFRGVSNESMISNYYTFDGRIMPKPRHLIYRNSYESVLGTAAHEAYHQHQFNRGFFPDENRADWSAQFVVRAARK